MWFPKETRLGKVGCVCLVFCHHPNPFHFQNISAKLASISGSKNVKIENLRNFPIWYPPEGQCAAKLSCREENLEQWGRCEEYPMCWEGFCWNFNLTGPQKNPSTRHKSLLLVVLWSCLLPGVSLQSHGACSECLSGGDCEWNEHNFTHGVGRLLIKHFLWVVKWPQLSPKQPSSPEAHGVSVLEVWVDRWSRSARMGWAGLCCHQCSVRWNCRVEAAGVRRRVICSQLKLLRVHDRANYLGNEAENAGRLEYYIVKSFRVNSVCDQISCCFKYRITCSTLVWANEYVWICHWICMPPNLINILTNSTGRDVWHKLHPSRSRLAQFVYQVHFRALLNQLHLGTGEPHPGRGCRSQGRDCSFSSALSPRRCSCSLGAGPQPSWQLWSAGDAFPGKPSTWEGCTVPTEALRSREWFWPDSAGCAEVHPCWVEKCVPGAFGIAALGAPGKCSCLRGASEEQPGPCIPWESRAPPAQVLFLRKCWFLKFRNSKTQ